MKVNKQKLFEAIKKNKEIAEGFVMTYSIDDFEYSPKDIRFLYKEIEFRTFNDEDEFKMIKHITEEDLEKVKEGFRVLNEKLAEIERN